jgi:hypothetical protein|tara:strand:- start:4470 stop:6611 length:2142 start_codon:yes stop_codon:yes gene_type:complete
MASDSQQAQRDIFTKLEGLLTFLEVTEQKKTRENLEDWKEVLSALKDIGSNPIPLLLELLKLVKGSIKAKGGMSKVLGFSSIKKKKRKDKKDKDDGDFEEPKKSFREKNKISPVVSVWLNILNDILRQSIVDVLPEIEEIIYEEIIKAFGCDDLSIKVPVVGDGLSAAIVIEVDEIDLLKQLKNDPDSDVGKYMYENVGDFPTSGYPPGQSPFPINRFLRNLIHNNNIFPSTVEPSNPWLQTVYGASGRALFDIQVIPGAPVMLEIYPYFKDGSSVTQNYQSAPGTTVGGVQSGAEKFTFVEFIKDYFENVKLIEMQNFLGALLEIQTGFLSVRSESTNLEDFKIVASFMRSLEKMLDACDGADLGTPSSESVSHLSELYDDDSFFEFDVEEERSIELEAVRMSKNVISFESCGIIDVPVDNDLVDKGLKEILSSKNKDEEIKAFDLLLQKFASASAVKAGNEVNAGSMMLPVEIDFKEGLIKKLPQILTYCVMNPKGVLPVVVVSKLLNPGGANAANLKLFIKIFKRVIIRIVQRVLAKVIEYMFAILKQLILRMISNLIKEKLSEKAKKKLRLIKKLLDILLPFINDLANAKNCKEIFSIILALLMANAPDIPWSVPPFLVAASRLRAGTSPLGAFEKLVGKLQKHGIPVGDMPDGSPNLMSLFAFDMLQASDEEMTDNAATENVIMTGTVNVGGIPGIIMPFTKSTGILK